MQTRAADEVIVVNDGSTDDTFQRLKPYQGRLTLIDQTNQGGNAARNNGFAASTGDLVLFCDADAILSPEMLATLEQALQMHPEASYAYSGFRFGWKSFRSFVFDAERLRLMNFIHTSALIRRHHFPGFDPTVRRFQDWDVWLTMLAAGHTGTFVDAELFRVVEAPNRRGISQWRPSVFYRIPWHWFGWMLPSVRRYNEARAAILKKHGLV